MLSSRSFLPAAVLGFAMLVGGVVPGVASGGMNRFENAVLRVTLEDVPRVTAAGQAVRVRVRVESRGETGFRGEIELGGPTDGIHAISERRFPFAVEPGEKAEIVFEIGFAADCETGWYPVHAFVHLTDGRDDRLHLVTLVDVAIPREPDWRPMERAEVVLEPGALQNPVLRMLDGQRVAAVADYVRGKDVAEQDLALRLGGEAEGFWFLAMPGERGLLDGHCIVVGPGQEVDFRGFRLALRVPAGVENSGEIEVTGYEIEAREGGFAVRHALRVGEWVSEVTVEAEIGAGMVRLRAVSPDPVSGFGLGPANLAPASFTAGVGHRFAMPETWRFETGSPLVEVPMAGFGFDGGFALVQAAEQPFQALAVSRAERVARAEVGGGEWLYLIPSEESVYAAALRWRARVGGEPGARATRLQKQLWIDGASGSYRDQGRRLAEAHRFGVRNLVYATRNWERAGGGAVFPEVWPPNPARGTLAEMQQFAYDSRQLGVIWGLRDRFDVIDPRAFGFRYERVQFDDEGAPLRVGWEGKDAMRYRLDPEAALPFLRENLKQIRYHFLPRLAVLAGVPSMGAEFRNQAGRLMEPERVEEAWREMFRSAREYLEQDSVIVAEGGEASWLGPLADGLIWDSGSEGLPGDPVRVPWWSLLHHSGVAWMTAAEEKDEPWRETVLDGRVPVVDHRSWGRELVRTGWMVQPVTARMAGKRLEAVQLDAEEPSRMECQWEGEVRIWTNGSDLPWPLPHRVLAAGGFAVDAPGLQGGIFMVGDRRCEELQAVDSWYVNARPEWKGTLGASPVLQNVRLIEDGTGCLVDVSWRVREPSALPLRAMLCLRDTLEGENAERCLSVTPPGLALAGESVSTYALSLGDLEVGRYALSVVLLTPGDRPLQMEGPRQEAGRYRDFGVRLGDLLVHRRDEQGVLELEFEAAAQRGEVAGDKAVPPVRDPAEGIDPAHPVALDWTTTDGAFRLQRRSDGLRLIPLPDSPAFEAVLHLDKLGVFGQRAVGVVAREAFSARWELQPVNLSGRNLSILHDPRFFAYDILLQE